MPQFAQSAFFWEVLLLRLRVWDDTRFHVRNDRLFGNSDFSADTAAFYVAIVHRLREHRWDNELTAVTRFDLVVDFERVRRSRDEEYRAILTDIDVIDAIHRGRPGARRGINNFESAWQKIDDRHVGDRFPLQTANVQSHVDRLANVCTGDNFVILAENFAINL